MGRVTKNTKYRVPFDAQQWMLRSLSHSMIHELANYVLDVYEGKILKEAEVRHAEGYLEYDSTMYGWTPEQRLENVVEELADAIVYLTSGPIPTIKMEENDG
jgi:hypothetical protein